MREHTITDRELLADYRNGNTAALETLISRHKDKVFTSIKIFVKDTYLAEDIFQDTFIKVIDTLKKGKYNEEGKFAPWVMRIAHNLCIDFFRKTKRMPTITTEEGFDIFDVIPFEGDNIERTMERTQTRTKVRHLLDTLPQEQKEVVILRHYAELSFKEIAQITNVSINTALGRMRYALINMRRTIEEKNLAM